MTDDECGEWLKDLINEASTFRATDNSMGMGSFYDNAAVAGWSSQAKSALEALLPNNHPIIRQWVANQAPPKEPWNCNEQERVDRFRALVVSAFSLLQHNRLGSIFDGIRTETESEVLDQAAALVSKGYVVAVAVLAGGALETHLSFLCTKHELTLTGSGSISKYDGAIAQARNAGNEIYSATVSKDVTAWGGMRNDAAHKPTEFSASKERVALMVDGIRGFIARVN